MNTVENERKHLQNLLENPSWHYSLKPGPLTLRLSSWDHDGSYHNMYLHVIFLRLLHSAWKLAGV